MPFGDTPFGQNKKTPFGSGPFAQSRNALTQSQRELRPYIQEEYAEEEEKRDRLQPLMKIFDLLQRGQYVSANVVDETINSIKDDDPFKKDLIDTAVAAWEGLTGKRKGSYEQVLSKHLDWTNKGIIETFGGNVREGSFWDKDWADLLGFVGDVVLDPLTYIGNPLVLKSTTKAAAVASDFAEKGIKMWFRTIGKNADELADVVVKGGGDLKKFYELMDESAEKAMKYLTSYSDEVAMRASMKYNDLYKFGLMNPAEELDKVIQGMAEKTPGAISDAELMEYIGNFEGAGEAARKLFGMEYTKGPMPQHSVARSFDQLASRIKKWHPLGDKMPSFEEAWWTIMNRPNGGIAQVRKMFGFRNPYQKLLRQKELNSMAMEAQLFSQDAARILSQQAADEETVQTYLRAIIEAEDLARFSKKGKYVGKKGTGVHEFFDKELGQARTKKGIYTWKDWLNQHADELGPDLVAKTNQYGDVFEQMGREFRRRQNDNYAKGLSAHINEIVNYLPKVTKRVGKVTGAGGGVFRPSFTKTRSYTMKESMDQHVKLFQHVFGIDAQAAEELVRVNNLSALNFDPVEAWLYRASGQAKADARANLLEQIKEFGAKFDFDDPELAAYAGIPSQYIQEFGLKKIDHKALQDIWFDKDVADVFERAVRATDPKEINKYAQMFRDYTSWWRGIVTTTTGFHIRNNLSNQVAGFLNYGPQWFSPRRQMESLVGAAYAIGKTPQAFFKQIGVSDGLAKQLLNKKIHGKTIQELADYARTRGVISEFIQAGSGEELAESAAGKMTWNPMKRNFAPVELSHRAGTYVESTPRFQSFLTEFERGGGTDTALEQAVWRAKGIFLDYTDLTDFERNVMKNIIPFYTWLRKNLANQVRWLWQYPEQFSIFPKLHDAAHIDDPNYDPALIPEWMQSLAMIPTAQTEGGTYKMLNPNVLYQDINKIPLMFSEERLIPQIQFGELKDDILAATHPMIKTLMEVVIPQKGYDVWRKQDLGDTRKAPYLLRFLSHRPEVLGVVDGFLQALGHEKGLQVNFDNEGRMYIDAKIAKTLENNLPILDWLAYAMYIPNYLIPGLEETLQETLGVNDNWDEEDSLEFSFQLLSKYGGVKFKETDLDEYKRNLAVDIYNRAREKKSLAERYTPEAVQRRADYKRRIEGQVRRMRK